MPEIAEVARVTHFLRQHLVGRRIAKAAAQDDANVFGKVGTSGPAVAAALTGRRVVAAGSQGKYFWLELDAPPHPVMHLGMTGWVHIRGQQTAYTRYAERAERATEKGDVWPPKYWKFHLETETEPGTASDPSPVCVALTDPRRFGRVRLVDCPGPEIRSHSPLVENGPDPVVDIDRFTETYLRDRMRGRHVPIKALLLDQAMISGIGNWVGDEVLYQAALHPEQYSDDFSDAEISRLYAAVLDVCGTAVRLLGDSDQFPPNWLFNHRWGKGKKDAPKSLPTGEKIIFLQVGGRTSCVVPSRQKKTGRVTADAKVEEADEEGKVKKVEKKKSRFFEEEEEEEDSRGDSAVKEEPGEAVRLVKRSKMSTGRKAAVKEEEDEKEEHVLADLAESKPKKGGRKPTVKTNASLPPPDTGRRRSTRLGKAAS